jgi:hypothetical protein
VQTLDVINGPQRTDYEPPFNLEIFELGGWHSIAVINDLAEALRNASALCYELREERIRLIDNNNKII